MISFQWVLLVLTAIMSAGALIDSSAELPAEPPPHDTPSLFSNHSFPDPFENFFAWLGGKNSSKDVCNSLRSSYISVCHPHSHLLDKFCHDFLKAYKSRCEHRQELVSSIGIVAVLCVLITCFLIGNGLELIKFTILPQSGASILIGFLVGGFLKATVSDPTKFQFDESVFFLVFLPYIIFEAGLTVDKRLLWEQLAPIALFSILGTFISIFFVGYGLYWASGWAGYPLPIVESLLFGSLISSTDPIATLSVFSSFGVDQTLYILVFGESVLNDGVSVVMYDAFIRLIGTQFHGTETFKTSIARFLVVFFGSMVIGVLFGLSSALLFKYGHLRHSPYLETLMFCAAALFPYYTCEYLQWSGIVAILAESVVMDLYTYQNLSKVAQQNTKFTIKCIAHLLEQCIFAYLGMQVFLAEPLFEWHAPLVLAAIIVCLVSRLWVYPVAGAVNLARSRADRIPTNYQSMMWFSGLRGAVSFALAMKIPQYDELLGTGSQYVRHILAATTAVVMYTVFIHGGLTAYMLRWLKIPMGVQTEGEEQTVLVASTSWVMNIHQQVLQPLLVRKSEEFVPRTGWSRQYAAIDDSCN